MAFNKRLPIYPLLINELTTINTELKKTDETDQYESTKFLLPSGISASKAVIAGTLTEVENIGTDKPFVKARIVDANGAATTLFAGQYQTEAIEKLLQLTVPTRVLVSGKISMYVPKEGDNPIMSLKPETIVEITEADATNFLAMATTQFVTRMNTLNSPEMVSVKTTIDEKYPDFAESAIIIKDLCRVELLRCIGETVPDGIARNKDPKTEIPEEPVKETPEKAEEKPKKPKGKDIQPPLNQAEEAVLKAIVKTSEEIGVTNMADIEAELKTQDLSMLDVGKALQGLMNQGRIFEPKVGMFKATE